MLGMQKLEDLLRTCVVFSVMKEFRQLQGDRKRSVDSLLVHRVHISRLLKILIMYHDLV